MKIYQTLSQSIPQKITNKSAIVFEKFRPGAAAAAAA